LLHGKGEIRFALPAAGTTPTTDANCAPTSASPLDEASALTVVGNREALMQLAQTAVVQRGVDVDEGHPLTFAWLDAAP
jgi:hypothetical protein